MNLLEAGNSEVQTKISAAEAKLEESEQYSRRNNPIIWSSGYSEGNNSC